MAFFCIFTTCGLYELVVGFRYVVCSSMIEFLIPSEVDHIGNWSNVVRKFEAMIYY